MDNQFTALVSAYLSASINRILFPVKVSRRAITTTLSNIPPSTGTRNHMVRFSRHIQHPSFGGTFYLDNSAWFELILFKLFETSTIIKRSRSQAVD
jgi:hypothetical protein